GTKYYLNNMTAQMETKRSTSPWLNWSYYKKAFDNAKDAHILIVNHALLSADLYLDHERLPHYDKAIIDEAHNFEENVSKQFSLSINFQYIRFKLKEIGTTKENGKLAQFLRETG